MHKVLFEFLEFKHPRLLLVSPSDTTTNYFNMGTTIAKLQGVVAGLVGVYKDLTTNVNHVTQTIGEMAQAVP